MPSHPDRVQKQYDDMCIKCLKNQIAFFASDTYMGINRSKLCSECLLEYRTAAIARQRIDE